jgi:hypothetical protein
MSDEPEVPQWSDESHRLELTASSLDGRFLVPLAIVHKTSSASTSRMGVPFLEPDARLPVSTLTCKEDL